MRNRLSIFFISLIWCASLPLIPRWRYNERHDHWNAMRATLNYNNNKVKLLSWPWTKEDVYLFIYMYYIVNIYDAIDIIAYIVLLCCGCSSNLLFISNAVVFFKKIYHQDFLCVKFILSFKREKKFV